MKKLSKWIKQKGFSQSEAAELFGITQSHLSLLLSGKRKPSIGLLKEIESITDIERKYLRPDLFGV
jgi:transcriptional regulator with XRE-family HTH domain